MDIIEQIRKKKAKKLGLTENTATHLLDKALINNINK